MTEHGKPLDITPDAASDEWAYNGATFGTRTGAFIHGLMGFCACGQPEDAVGLIHDCLNGPPRGDRPGPAPLDFDAVVAAIKADPERAAWFVMYALDAWQLTEHGGSVLGSWLTERGQQAVQIFSGDGCDPNPRDTP